MAILFDDITRLITIEAPAIEITCQDLLNAIREFEYSTSGIDDPQVASAAGKEALGGGVIVGITLTLIDWKVKFEDRAGPTWSYCNVSGGNLVSVDSLGAEQFPLEPSAYVMATLTASSSATLQELGAIQYSSFGGGITVDIANGVSGTAYPIGTEQQPVNNTADALLIAQSRGFNAIFINGDITLNSGTDFDELIFIGESPTKTTIDINSAADVTNCEFYDAHVTGTLDGGNVLVGCLLTDLTYVNGYINNCILGIGTIVLGGGGDAHFLDCWSGVVGTETPAIDMGGSGQGLGMRNYNGGIEIKNKSGASDEISIDLNSGHIVLTDTVTAGDIVIRGIGKLTDNSVGATVYSDDLLSKETIAKAVSISYGSVVYIDVANGTSGTAAPQGTEKHPVNNLPDALTIAVREKIDKLDVAGSLTITTGQDISGYTLISDRSLGNTVTVNSGAITAGTYFENLTVSGTMNGSVRYTTSVMGVINNFDGGAKNCLLVGDIFITGTGFNYFTDCDVYVTDSSAYRSIDLNGYTLNIIRCRGNYEISNKTSINTTSIDLVGGRIHIDNTCTAGIVEINGIAEVVDDSAAGCVVEINSMSHTAISENVWDESLTGETHNLPSSAGRKLRQLNTSVIHEGTAQEAGTNNNQIQLDINAASINGAYDPSLISIIDNTGAGQSRLILQYEGSTRIATVDRSWKIAPDDTSVFIISAHAGREHVNEGLAQDGTANTIKLNALASSTDNVYNGQVIFIRSGTGEDQARRIIAYDGTTKIATVGSAFPIIPDTTSAYVILSTGTISHKMIADAVWDEATAGHEEVDSFGELAADILRLLGNKVTKSGEIITIYEEDESTPWKQYDLTDDGRVEV